MDTTIYMHIIHIFSYQEEDLAKLREKWSEALDKRRQYLDEQLQKIMNKEGLNYQIKLTFSRLLNTCRSRLFSYTMYLRVSITCIY